MDLSLTFLMPPRYLHTSPWGRQGNGESLTFNGHATTRHDTNIQTDSQCTPYALRMYVCPSARNQHDYYVYTNQPVSAHSNPSVKHWTRSTGLGVE